MMLSATCQQWLSSLLLAVAAIDFRICKSLFTNNMVDDKKQKEITEKLN